MTESPIAVRLPRVYDALFPAFFRSDWPAETRASCGSCAMSPNAGLGAEPTDGQRLPRFYRRDTKCCTFHPDLPNYLVGAALAESAESPGHQRIRKKITDGLAVFPIGIAAPAGVRLLFANTFPQAFGRNETLRCPYFMSDSGGCAVYAHRERVCSTWHCKQVLGARGEDFWNRMSAFLETAEARLSEHALRSLAPDLATRAENLFFVQNPLVEKRAKLTESDIDPVLPGTPQYDDRWGAWAGRETELYLAAYALVKKLSAAQFMAIVGADGASRLSDLKAAYAKARSIVLPRQLVWNAANRVIADGNGDALIYGYSSTDPARLPQEVAAALRSAAPASAAKIDGLLATSHTDAAALYQLQILIDGGDSA